ncbi:hypothetical protein [Pandoraea morbifera]|uniref:hypothetical protein n=1 Tax=Pandoraea morbifera TaxID=2508300 RepID=UPI001FE317E3|nr:hypothetical protein [Pandoraea morbifera]
MFHQLEQARFEEDALTSGISGKISASDLAILPLEGTRLLEMVQLFYNGSSANPVLPVALSCIEEPEKRISTLLLT